MRAKAHKTQAVSFQVPVRLWEWLREYTGRTYPKSSMSQHMVAALVEYLERRKGTNEALDSVQRNRDRIMEVLDEKGGEK